MSKLFFLALISVAFANKNILDGRIVGGEAVTIEGYPYQLSLLYKGLHACGATIISKRFAVTAAHCTNGLSTSDFSVRAGSSYRNSGGVVVGVYEIHEHPYYDQYYLDFDLSLLELEDELEFSSKIQPIGLPTFFEYFPPGSLGTSSGYGTTTEGGPPAEQLHAVNVNLVDPEECEKAYKNIVITERMICTGVYGGGKDACNGDEGGPMVIDGKLVGVVSWSYGCARPEYPGVYASVPMLRQFIREKAGI